METETGITSWVQGTWWMSQSFATAIPWAVTHVLDSKEIMELWASIQRCLSDIKDCIGAAMVLWARIVTLREVMMSRGFNVADIDFGPKQKEEEGWIQGSTFFLKWNTREKIILFSRSVLVDLVWIHAQVSEEEKLHFSGITDSALFEEYDSVVNDFFSFAWGSYLMAPLVELANEKIQQMRGGKVFRSEKWKARHWEEDQFSNKILERAYNLIVSIEDN